MKQQSHWIKRTLIALFGVGIAAGSLTACSHTSRGWGGSDDGDRTAWQARMIERVAGRLDLDTTQKQKLETLATTMREQRKAFMGSADPTPRTQMQALIAGSTFDRARAQSLLDEKIAAVRSQSPAVIAAMADFYDSLNAGQQQKVREFTEKRRHGWRRHG